MAGYSGVLAASEIIVTGTLPNGPTTKNVTYFIIDTDNTIVGTVALPDAAERNTSVSIPLKVAKASTSYAIGTFDENRGFQASSFLTVRNSTSDQRPTGAIGRAG
jgi:hypothetical protein